MMQSTGVEPGKFNDNAAGVSPRLYQVALITVYVIINTALK